MASCAALLAMLIALLFGGSTSATAPATGAAPAQATSASASTE